MPISIVFPNVIDSDGKSAGTVVDFARNHGDRASELLASLVQWNSEQAAAAASAIKSAQDAKSEAESALTARIALQNQLIAAAQAAHASGDMDAVGAVIVEAAKDDVQRKKDTLAADIAAKQAELAKLG